MSASREQDGTILEKLGELISEQFDADPGEIAPETSFIADLGADELDMVELLMAIEEEFNIGECEDDALCEAETVFDVIKFIQEHGMNDERA